jgi:predicted phage terminase large subunit-like protein
MNAPIQQLLHRALRDNFPSFLVKVFETLHPGEPPLVLVWYLEAICHALREVGEGRARRLVITVPPRHLKSIAAAVAFPAWLMGRDPTIKIMVASYSQELARLHSTMTRTVMESAWYQAAFPGTRIAKDGNRLLELATTRGGFRKAVSVEGSLTGFGADIIVIDDCMKAGDASSQVMRDALRDWYDNTLASRLNNKREGRIVSIQQRLHEDDLPAYLLEKGFSHLDLPAIAEREELLPIGPNRSHQRRVGDLLNPEREDRTVLDQLRCDLGPMVFSAQYQQCPTAPEGNLLRMEWFSTYDKVPERHEFLKVFQSWDTGMTDEPTSDFSVCTTWGFRHGENKWYLIDVLRQRLAFPDLLRAVVMQQKVFQADIVLVEKACSGISLAQQLKVSGPFRPVLIKPAKSKEERLIGCLAEIESGRFFLPSNAPWLAALRSELRAFPSGKYDDQVDSLSQFVHFQRSKWRSIYQERTPSGRPMRNIRLSQRPF